jgi:hypothetical protein
LEVALSELDELFPQDRVWEYENGFYVTSDTSRLGKLFAHYELYRRITDLPGHVVELGVYKGASLIRFATIRELLESPTSRKIIGFDAFGAFPTDGLEADDASFVDRFETAGGDGFSRDMIAEALERKHLRNVDLVEGNILETVPAFVAEHSALRLALLHLDMDVYEPTKVALDHLGDRVVRGGLIVIDDFGTVGGATRAVEEFLADRDLRIEKLPIAHIPAFIVVD